MYLMMFTTYHFFITGLCSILFVSIFQTYYTSLIDGAYKELGFTDSANDPQLVVYNRLDVLWRACKLEVVDCIVNAVRQFENWRNSPDPDKLNP